MTENNGAMGPGSTAPLTVSGQTACRRAIAPTLAVVCGLVLSTLHAPARADIWGFVDSERLPHFAPNKLDERYELLLKDSEVVEPFQPMGIAAKAPAVPQEESSAADGEQTSSSAGGIAATAVSPKLLAFFDRSENYKAVSPLLLEASKVHGIDYSLLKALITAESGFNTYAVSPKGAVGLMQLIPPTAQRYGVAAGKGSTIAKKLTDPKINIRAGARYLADLIKMFPGRLELAVAAYNAGEGAVQRAGNKVPNYPETQNYVKTVMQLYKGLAPSTQPQGGRVRVELKAQTGGSSGYIPDRLEMSPSGQRP